MTEKKQTALQRWGSRESSPRGRVVLYLGAFLVVGLMVGVGIYFATRVTDDRLERQEVLDQRYQEKVEIFTINVGGQPEIIHLDGEPREDCDDTDDGYLVCTDDPQPTLDPAAG